MVIIFCFIEFFACFFVRKKKCVSAFGWRTVFDFLSAKIRKINEREKSEGEKYYQELENERISLLN